MLKSKTDRSTHLHCVYLSSNVIKVMEEFTKYSKKQKIHASNQTILYLLIVYHLNVFLNKHCRILRNAKLKIEYLSL